MSEILANIVVDQNNINFQPDVNNINLTPDAISLNIFTTSAPGAGQSSNTELLFNSQNLVDGVPFTSYDGSKLTLGNAANLKITGGTNTYYLQTDGAGNLTWAVGTGNITGNGAPGGANTQIQFNDGGANFGGSAGLTFDKNSNIFTAPGIANIGGNINTGGVITASGANLSSCNVNGTLNAVVLRTSDTEIGLGLDAGQGPGSQGTGAIAIGTDAGYSAQQAYAVAVGYRAGRTNQGTNSVAIGNEAGANLLGANSIAIGYGAGANLQGANSIVINATGANLINTTANTFTVKPIRNNTTANVLFYDNPSGEITYGIISTVPTANTVTDNAQPNITSVGNLTSLVVSGNSNVAGNLNVTGSSNLNGNISTIGTSTVQQIKEKIITNGTGANGTINFDILSSAIILQTANAIGNFTLNFRGNSSVTFNNFANINESVTCSFINKNGVTAYIPTTITVDGSSTAVVWTGTTGNAGAGTPNGYDLYTFNLLKTAANTYVVLSSRTGYI